MPCSNVSSAYRQLVVARRLVFYLPSTATHRRQSDRLLYAPPTHHQRHDKRRFASPIKLHGLCDSLLGAPSVAFSCSSVLGPCGRPLSLATECKRLTCFSSAASDFDIFSMYLRASGSISSNECQDKYNCPSDPASRHAEQCFCHHTTIAKSHPASSVHVGKHG